MTEAKDLTNEMYGKIQLVSWFRLVNDRLVNDDHVSRFHPPRLCLLGLETRNNKHIDMQVIYSIPVLPCHPETLTVEDAYLSHLRESKQKWLKLNMEPENEP